MLVKLEGDALVLTEYAAELYVPYEYSDAELFSMIGENTRFYGIANYRVFKNEKEMKTPDAVKCIPLGISAFILTKPSEIDVGNVQYTKGGSMHRCYILRYYKNDKFIADRNVIKAIDSMEVVMNMLESGKLEHIPPDMVTDLLAYAQKINKVNLKTPSSNLDMIVSERFRDPNNPNQKLRFSKGANKDGAVSPNMREEAITGTTYQAISFEDINSSVLASVNRANGGVKDEASIMEQIIKGERVKDD